jgi:hemerythrin-like metal-binding protein
MKLLQWNPEFSIGIASIDDEHREMIDLINLIYAELAADADVVQIDECLGDIFSAISMHFALEERMMRACGYEGYAAHKDDHEELLEQIRDLMDDFTDDTEIGAEQLSGRLSDWFTGHFASFDARLHGKLGRLP